MIFNILLTLFLVFLNGFFVAAEFSIVKIRSSKLELRIRSGSFLAKLAKGITEHLDAYLSATQLGITLASLGLGWIGESVVSEIIKEIFILFQIPFGEAQLHSIALPVAFITITMLHIVFGELAPKSIAIQRAEQTTLAISIPLRFFYIIFSPFIWILNSTANLILRLIGFQAVGKDEELHSSDEIRLILEESTKSGAIGISEHELLENVFEFQDTPIKQIMVPRRKIQGVEIGLNLNDVVTKFISEGYSRMPVYEKTIDNIIGIIYAKDLLNMLSNENLIIIEDIIRPPFFVQEDEKIKTLLHRMQKDKILMAIVIDEFGGTAGLVTMEDIIEEIVGEIQDEYDEETPIVEKINEETFIVKAEATIADANDYLPFLLPESDDYETIGGLIIDEIGNIPELNEIIRLDNYECKILKRSKRSIESIKLTVRKTDDETDEVQK